MADFLDNVSVSDGRSKKKRLKKQIADLWIIWCNETNRPDPEEINSDVHDQFEHWLTEGGYSFDELAYITAAASRLKPSRDAHDVRRLIRALSDEDIEDEAVQLYENSKREAYEYKPYRAKLLMSRAELAEIIGDDETAWTDDEDSEALWLITHMDVDAAQTLRYEIEDAGFWEGALTPSEFREFKRTRKWRENISDQSPQRKKRSKTGGRIGTSSYVDGEQESKRLEDVQFSVDPAAEKLYQRSHDIRRTTDFHFRAPEGYWNEVGELLDDGKSLSEAYDDLVIDYDWHPSDRSIS